MRFFIQVLLLATAMAQDPDYAKPPKTNPDAPVRLPNGKLQSEEILKADFEKSLKDAARLVELAQSLEADLKKDDRHVLSISAINKTEEIEKIAKRLRGRMRRF